MAEITLTPDYEAMPSMAPYTEGPGQLTPQKMTEWNQYVDYVASRGYKGSKELDKRDTGLAVKLFEEFKQANPNIALSLDDVAAVQTEMQRLKQTVQEFAKRKGDPNAENLMTGISPVDSWPGSKTTQFKFPALSLQLYHNNQFVSGQNLGLVDSSLKPVSTVVKRLPKGAKLETLSDGRTYYEDENGDLVLYQ